MFLCERKAGNNTHEWLTYDTLVETNILRSEIPSVPTKRAPNDGRKEFFFQSARIARQTPENLLERNSGSCACLGHDDEDFGFRFSPLETGAVRDELSGLHPDLVAVVQEELSEQRTSQVIWVAALSSSDTPCVETPGVWTLGALAAMVAEVVSASIEDAAAAAADGSVAPGDAEYSRCLAFRCASIVVGWC